LFPRPYGYDDEGRWGLVFLILKDFNADIVFFGAYQEIGVWGNHVSGISSLSAQFNYELIVAGTVASHVSFVFNPTSSP